MSRAFLRKILKSLRKIINLNELLLWEYAGFRCTPLSYFLIKCKYLALFIYILNTPLKKIKSNSIIASVEQKCSIFT